MKSHETLTHAMQAYQSGEEPERLFAIAGKYWRIMLVIEIAIFIGAIIAGAYLLFIALYGTIDTKSVSGATQTINTTQLSRTVEGFNDRHVLFDQLKSGAGSVPDPSR
jgi:hypothetical protein